jgi:hypothetical protein
MQNESHTPLHIRPQNYVFKSWKHGALTWVTHYGKCLRLLADNTVIPPLMNFVIKWPFWHFKTPNQCVANVKKA